MVNTAMSWGEFSKETIESLGRRARFYCSNPNCGAPTGGPNRGLDGGRRGAIRIGEAAHIHGARIGHARHSPGLSLAEREDITNGIWLCRDCHEMVDEDPDRFSADLLLRWRQQRETATAQASGKSGKIKDPNAGGEKKFAAFRERSPLAHRIVTDKPEYWEYKLTIVLLQEPVGRIRREYEDLSKGFSSRNTSFLEPDQFERWVSAKIEELSAIGHALAKTVNERFPVAWGLPGEAGNEWEIFRSCDLVIEACGNLLRWEENVRSTKSTDEFEEAINDLGGIAGRLIEQVEGIATGLSKPFETDPPSGRFDVRIVIDLPEGFRRDYSKRYKKALREYYRQKYGNKAVVRRRHRE